MIGPTINEKDAWIGSVSTGDCFPASAANSKSDRNQKTGWRYDKDDTGINGINNWEDGDIRVTCITHS